MAARGLFGHEIALQMVEAVRATSRGYSRIAAVLKLNHDPRPPDVRSKVAKCDNSKI